MIRSRPVKARATLTIRLFASVPLFVKRRRSKEGTRWTSSSASSTWNGLGPIHALPRATCRVAASTIRGFAWPWMSDVALFARST